MPDNNSETDTTSNLENLRNLALILGITALLVVAVILVGFFISGLANVSTTVGSIGGTGANTASATSTTTTNTPNTDTTDKILGSLGGGLADSKPSNSNPAPVANPVPVPAPAAVPAPAPANTTPDAETGSSYIFTATSGDSVTWLARRAMYAYLGDRGYGLSAAQRLYFETTLTQQSNPAAINVGETRTFTAASMDQIYHAANNLSGIELNGWTALVAQSGYV